MAHGHGRHVSHLVPAENIILGFIIWVPIVYFFTVLITKGVQQDLFTLAMFQSGFGTLFWSILMDTWVHWIAPVFVSADIFLLCLLVYSTVKVWHIRGRLSIKDPPTHHGHVPSPQTAEHAAKAKRNPAVLKYWTAIVHKANTGTPENLRSSVLEADALVDFFLKHAGYSGEHMADRLSQISRTGVKSLDRVWDTHRLRNEIAHTPGFAVSPARAEQALLAVRDFLKEMKAF